MKRVINLILGMMTLGSTAAVAGELAPVGLQKQLLVDDYVIAEKHNITRELGKVQKLGIVLKPTLPTDFIPPPGQRGDEGRTSSPRSGPRSAAS